jgi:hypothetical protein
MQRSVQTDAYKLLLNEHFTDDLSPLSVSHLETKMTMMVTYAVDLL